MKRTVQDVIDQCAWKHPQNYIGECYPNYVTVLGKHRDSDTLEQSNFDVALEMLGGVDAEELVITSRASHWAVGWVETILVSIDSEEKLKIVAEILDALDNYPVLDDCDLSEREEEARCSDFETCGDSMMVDLFEEMQKEGVICKSLLSKEVSDLTKKQTEQLEEVARYCHYEDCSNRGVEDGWARLDCGMHAMDVKHGLEASPFRTALLRYCEKKGRV